MKKSIKNAPKQNVSNNQAPSGEFLTPSKVGTAPALPESVASRMPVEEVKTGEPSVLSFLINSEIFAEIKEEMKAGGSYSMPGNWEPWSSLKKHKL